MLSVQASSYQDAASMASRSGAIGTADRKRPGGLSAGTIHGEIVDNDEAFCLFWSWASGASNSSAMGGS